MPLPGGGKFDDMRIRFDAIPECDGRTNGLCYINIALYTHSMLTRDKTNCGRLTKLELYTYGVACVTA